MKADLFAIEHSKNFKNYCEVVILPDGDIQYAVPSHQYKLCTMYGISYEEDILEHSDKYEELLKQIPMVAGPLHWMVEDLNVVSCWYNGGVFPLMCTEAQIESVKRLLKEGCLSTVFDVEVSVEKSLTKVRDETFDLEAIEDLIHKRNLKEHEIRELLKL